MLMESCNFIKQKEACGLGNKIADVNKAASVSVHFICRRFIMYRFNVKIISEKHEMEELV